MARMIIGAAAGTLILVLWAVKSAAPQVDGAATYKQSCRTCHGVTGVPPQRALDQYKNIATFADPGFFAGRSDDSLVAVITKGIGKDMKPFKEKLTNGEIVAVAKYIRTLMKPKQP